MQKLNGDGKNLGNLTVPSMELLETASNTRVGMIIDVYKEWYIKQKEESVEV